MSVGEGLVDWLEETTAPLGTLSKRAMMGGATFYLDGVAFAIAGLDDFWFKADAESDADWDAIGAEKFSFTFTNGRTGVMNYRKAPQDVHDDPEAMREWAALALAAGRRAAAKKKPSSSKPRKRA